MSVEREKEKTQQPGQDRRDAVNRGFPAQFAELLSHANEFYQMRALTNPVSGGILLRMLATPPLRSLPLRPHPESPLGMSAAPWRTSRQLAELSKTTRSENDSFSFAVLGDAEPGRFWIFRALFNRKGVFARQLQAIQEQSVDFSIQLGDMVSRGVEGNYRRFFHELSGVGVRKPYLTVIGNHDRHYPHGVSNSILYRSLIGPTRYHFDRGGVRFVVADSSANRMEPSQLRWLKKALDTPLRKVVFTHIPPALLSLWGDRGAVRKMGGFTEGAREFTEVLSECGVDRVYMGHVHGFGVQDYLGVRYILTGGGGSPLFPCGAKDRFYHYLTVSVGPWGIRDHVHTLEGSSFLIPSGRVIYAAA